MRFLLSSLMIGAIAAPLAASDTSRPFTVEQTGAGYTRLADAVSAIGEGNGTILIAPGTYRECAVQLAGDIAYKARDPGTVIFDGVACEGKAAFVLRGRSAAVDGIIFQNISVPDMNGAGIRLEHGNLTITNTMFRNAQQGILTGNDPAGTIRIDHSTFAGLGICPDGGSCAHSIYVGDYGALSVSRSRFERGTGGHYVKSRAPIIEVVDSSFDDSAGKATNYMIDLPAGASGTIQGNMFVQGKDKENYSAFIAVGAEGVVNSSGGLKVIGNRAMLAPGVDRTTSFVGNWTRDAIQISGNQLGAGLKASDQR